MGYRAAVQQVIEQVRLIIPRTGPEPFICDDDGGAMAPLEKLAESGMARTRVFDVRMTALPADDGLASGKAGNFRFRATAAVRVYYERHDFGDVPNYEAMVAEDATDIIARLADASNWDAATNQIDSLVIARSTPAAQLVADGAGVIVSIPFILIYHEDN